MKPSVPPVGEADCRSGEEEGERERWRGRGGGGEAWTYNVAHLSEHRNKSGAATLMWNNHASTSVVPLIHSLSEEPTLDFQMEWFFSCSSTLSCCVSSFCLIKNISISALLIMSGCLNQINRNILPFFFPVQESTLNVKILIKNSILNAHAPLLRQSSPSPPPPRALAPRDSDTVWHEKRTLDKDIIPGLFIFKEGFGKQEYGPRLLATLQTLWSIRACDGFCIDQENVGWWSGLEGALEGVAPFLMVATLHTCGKRKQLLLLFFFSLLLALWTWRSRWSSLCERWNVAVGERRALWRRE